MLAVVVGVFILVVERPALVDREAAVRVVIQPTELQEQSIQVVVAAAAAALE
jgi:hypothetical protein